MMIYTPEMQKELIQKKETSDVCASIYVYNVSIIQVIVKNM